MWQKRTEITGISRSRLAHALTALTGLVARSRAGGAFQNLKKAEEIRHWKLPRVPNDHTCINGPIILTQSYFGVFNDKFSSARMIFLLCSWKNRI